MKKYLICLYLCLFIPAALFAQEDEEESSLFETLMLTPDHQNLDALTSAMSEHNKTFHSEGAYAARVYSIVSGPDNGKLMWVMGPMSSYGHLDDRPGGDDHTDHWFNEVMPYIDDMGTAEYWMHDDELSNSVEGDYSIYFMRINKINQDYGFLLDGAFEKISETVKAMEGDNPWHVFWNQFRQGDIGRHMLVEWPMKNWAELDENPEFRSTFEEIHGEDAWIPWLRTMDLVIEDSYDEIWTLIPEMNGNSE